MTACKNCGEENFNIFCSQECFLEFDPDNPEKNIKEENKDE